MSEKPQQKSEPTLLQQYPIKFTNPEWHGCAPMPQIEVDGTRAAVPAGVKCRDGDRLLIVPQGVMVKIAYPSETASLPYGVAFILPEPQSPIRIMGQNHGAQNNGTDTRSREQKAESGNRETE